MANDTQDTILLHTNDGSMGYRIVKFQVLAITANQDVESTMKIYKIAQDPTTLTQNIDFSDQTLLGAMIYNDSVSHYYMPEPIVIFDREIFNQDIYVTLSGNASLNYYIELEQVKLDLNENTVATLKDIRNLS